jgi:FkbM family methyltransferase
MIAALRPANRLVTSARQNNRPLTVATARTAESLARRAVPTLSKPAIRLGNYDARIIADLRTPTGLRLLRYGFHDPVAWAVDHLLQSGDTFIDAGANIGLMTLVGAARVGPRGRVLSIEPAPRTAELLEANVRVNGFDWVTVQRVAVGEHSGHAELVEFAAGSGLHSLAPHARSGGRSITVDVASLDELARTIDRPPALVKLDVEGAEVAVLRGAAEVLSCLTTSLIVEVESQHLRRQGATIQELRALLSDYAPYAVVATEGSFVLTPWRRGWDALPTSPNLVFRR